MSGAPSSALACASPQHPVTPNPEFEPTVRTRQTTQESPPSPKARGQPPPLFSQAQAGHEERQLTSAVLLSTGPCVVHGDCVCSSNWGAACDVTATNASGGYPLGETCEVTFSHPVTLNVIVFDMQDEYFEYTYNYGHPAPGCDYDNLTVNEVNKVDALVVLITSLYLHRPRTLLIPKYTFTSPSPPPRLTPPQYSLHALILKPQHVWHRCRTAGRVRRTGRSRPR